MRESATGIDQRRKLRNAYDGKKTHAIEQGFFPLLPIHTISMLLI